MKKTIVVTTLLILCMSSVYACLNEFGTDSDGRKVHHGHRPYAFEPSFDKADLSKRLKEMQSRNSKQYSFERQSDIAVYMLKLGQSAGALKILQKLNAEKPDNYRLVANLGTAYELNGQNDSALYYIKKGITLNPSSHNYSEWVHVRILEAKVAAAQNPGWLTGNSILKLNYASKPKPDMRINGRDFARLEDTLEHINYQLQERLPFTTAPDKFMAKLLIEAAELSAFFYSIEKAWNYYQLASIYDPDNKSVPDKIEKTEVLLKKYKSKDYEEAYLKEFRDYYSPEQRIKEDITESPVAVSDTTIVLKDSVPEMTAEVAEPVKVETDDSSSRVLYLIIVAAAGAGLGYWGYRRFVRKV